MFSATNEGGGMGNEDIRKSVMSRRSFVGAAGALAFAAAGVGLAGCSAQGNSETKDDTAWDEEADFVVCGGGTGLAGAIAAQANGASVIVLEKSDQVGGSTTMSGGGVWAPCSSYAIEEGDSREKAEAYLALLRQHQGDEELSMAFLDNTEKMVKLLEEKAGIEWNVSPLCDYHPEWEGGMRKGRAVTAKPAEGETPAMTLVNHMKDSVESNGGIIMTGTPAFALITETTESGTMVIGVEAGTEKKPVRIKANKGVLLATGGFEWDDSLKNGYLRGFAPYNVSSSNNTGDGLRMAMAIGADLANMNECWGQIVWAKDSETKKQMGAPAVATTMDRSKPGRIFVNRHGKRFCDEAGDYDTLARTFYAYEDWGACEYANMPAWLITDQASVDKYTLGKATIGDAMVVSEENIVKGSTLEELADLVGIDAVGLVETVELFNANALEGKDPDFHRGESFFDCTFMTDTAEGIIGTPAATLGAISTPPFYAIEIASGCLGTCGGPKVNANAQVVDTKGRPIEGLYASGNCAGIGAPGSSYGGPGGTIGPALTFATIAGSHATASAE